MTRRLIVLLLFAALCFGQQDVRAGWLPLAKPASGGGGTVAVTAASASIVDSTTTSLTVPLTIPAGSNLAAAVMVTWFSTTLPTGASATWNSVSATAVPGTGSGTHGGCTCATQIYAILAPTTGAHNFVVSWTGNLEAHAVAVSFSGVNQGSIAAAFPNGTNTVNDTPVASPITATITSATGHIVIAFGSQQVSGWGTINGTLIADAPLTGPNIVVAGNYNSGAATVTPSMAFTGTSSWTIVATDVSP